MKEIPTAKEYIRTNLTDFWDGGDAQYTEEDVAKGMIEFAKLHVEQALKEASENGQAKYDNVFEVYVSEVDKDSILNSYPLSNIK